MRSRFGAPVWVSALAIAIFQVAGSFGAEHNQPDRKSIDFIAILLILVGPAALTLRYRWPLITAAIAGAAAVVYVGLGYPYGPIFLSVAVAFFSVVQSRQRRFTWIVAAAGYVGYLIAAQVDPRTKDEPNWAHLALVAGWVAVVWVAAELVRTRREQFAERRKAEADEQRRRADERRLTLAQELHDVLAHNISLINVQASVALHLLEEDPSQAGPALVNIKRASSEALHELRGALDLLRDGDPSAPRTPAPRLADIEKLVAGVRSGGLEVNLDMVSAQQPLSAAVELATYRIVQEALTNVTRHAQARHVEVHIACNNGIDIEVTDDGRGGNPTPRGNGITGMRERVAALGGTIDTGPRKGTRGFAVRAHLPEKTS
jgi:signal transduction histidine kinase